MKLNLTFASQEAGDAFLLMTGESDLTAINVGLINLAVKAPGLVSCEANGAAIEFHVLGADGVTWTTEIVGDPVSRIQAGEVLEPANVPIKMLSAFDPSMIDWKERIANRYIPFVENPYFATLSAQRRVEVVLIDSGINMAHAEFDGVAVEPLFVLPAFLNTDDDLGHGTALASLIAGKTLGVNPTAVLKIVKISDRDRKPTLGELGDAIDAVYDYHMTCPEVPKVVNMSWSIPTSQYISTKLTRLIQAGLMLVAAGGNTAVNIDDATPSGLVGVFTVAGSNADDTEFAGVYGVNKKIDIYAPAQNLGVANFADVNDYLVNSGSSFAAAITSGVASLLFGLNAVLPSADDVKAGLVNDSTFNALLVNENVSVGENKLLHRPDTNSLDSAHTQYLGCIPITYSRFLGFDLKVLMPSVIFEGASAPTLTITFDDPSFASILDATTTEVGMLKIKLVEGAVLAEGEKIKRMSLTVTGEIPGASAETTTCYIFVSSPDATTDDTKAALEDLNAITEFAFLEDSEDSGPAKVKFPGSTPM